MVDCGPLTSCYEPDTIGVSGSLLSDDDLLWLDEQARAGGFRGVHRVVDIEPDPNLRAWIEI